MGSGPMTIFQVSGRAMSAQEGTAWGFYNALHESEEIEAKEREDRQREAALRARAEEEERQKREAEEEAKNRAAARKADVLGTQRRQPAKAAEPADPAPAEATPAADAAPLSFLLAQARIAREVMAWEFFRPTAGRRVTSC